MPLYEYQCEACAHRFEVIQKFSDPPIAACPQCGSAVAKLPSSPAIQFKGSGFYITDYARAGKSDGSSDGAKEGGKEGAAKKPAATEGKTDGTSGSSASDTSSAAKPETPAASKPAAGPSTSSTPKTSD